MIPDTIKLTTLIERITTTANVVIIESGKVLFKGKAIDAFVESTKSSLLKDKTVTSIKATAHNKLVIEV